MTAISTAAPDLGDVDGAVGRLVAALGDGKVVTDAESLCAFRDPFTYRLSAEYDASPP